MDELSHWLQGGHNKASIKRSEDDVDVSFSLDPLLFIDCDKIV